jgi:tetratricopeptide (TPR) repeat protein
MQRLINVFLILLLSPLFAFAAAPDPGLNSGILEIQHAWEHVHYQLPENEQEAAFAGVEKMADALMARYPGRAEPLAWKAIVLSTHAGAKGGLGALSLVRQARDLLEQAESIDPDALDGSIYTTLGSLYYQVPGWPIGFGDDKKAEEFLKKALTINPNGIDPNYFYGDYLYRKNHYSEALSFLEKAMQAPPRPNRPLADQGRRKEILGLIASIQEKKS